jgi:plasmid stabilization system protein ParE
MARRARLIWSEKAEADLDRVHLIISHRDSPKAARAFTRRIVAAAKRLRDYPEAGSPVEEFNDPTLRQTFVGSYRVIYRYRKPTIEILAVRHGAMLLREDDLRSE